MMPKIMSWFRKPKKSVAELAVTGRAKLSTRDLERLDGVLPDLRMVVFLAREYIEEPFMVVEGLRTKEQQEKYVAEGKSRTMKSKHLKQADGYSHAVDLCGTVKATSFDCATLQRISEAMLRAAKDLEIPVVWGGNWKSFVDMPHFEV